MSSIKVSKRTSERLAELYMRIKNKKGTPKKNSVQMRKTENSKTSGKLNVKL